MTNDPLHPIVTVLVSGSVTAQGPTVQEADVRRNSLPTDMHGNLAVQTGQHTVAVGRPIQKVRKA